MHLKAMTPKANKQDGIPIVTVMKKDTKGFKIPR